MVVVYKVQLSAQTHQVLQKIEQDELLADGLLSNFVRSVDAIIDKTQQNESMSSLRELPETACSLDPSTLPSQEQKASDVAAEQSS